jgi:predicted ArsR family transcriptional regulator
MGVKHQSDGGELGRLADVFGDRTRRAIFRHVLAAPSPLSAGEVGEVFHIHRTVARAHLEKLVGAGLVETSTRRRATGGRPAKVYAATGERLEVMLPPRRYEPLARLLLEVVSRLATTSEDAVVQARSAGGEYGREVLRGALPAGDRHAVFTPLAAAEWLDGAGYRTRYERDNGHDVITVENCVYRELAVLYPDVVCAFDEGLIGALVGADAEQHRHTHALSRGDAFCRHELSLAARPQSTL